MSIRREHFIWLIPIVVGAAAYWRAEAMHRIGDRAEIAGRSTGGVRGTERRFRNAAELDVELKRLRSEAHERQQRALDQVPLMGLEELKEELLSLDARIKQAEIAGDFEKGSKLRGRWFSVVDELGAKGGEAEAVWLLANCSQAMKDFIDAWAEAKPEEALHYIERSNLPGICETRTVMKMLDRLAKADPKKLKSAVGRVPWDLLVFEEGDPFEGAGMTPDIPDPADENVEVWWESGAARRMAEEGVHIHGLIPLWAHQDLSGAISAWAGWPGQERRRWPDDLATVLINFSRSEERREQLKDAIMKLDGDAARRVREAVARLQEHHPATARSLSEEAPIYKELLANPVPPP